MSGHHPQDPRSVSGRDDDDRWPLPVSPRRLRIKFLVFAGLGLLAPALGLPVWSQLALLTAALAIPAAVALHGGRRLLGMLAPPRLLAPPPAMGGGESGTGPAGAGGTRAHRPQRTWAA